MADDVVAAAKYQEALEQAQQAQAAKAKAEAELAKLRATYESSMSTANARAKKAEEALAAAELNHSMSLAMVGDGIKDEGFIDYIRHKYSGLQVEEGKSRPEFKDFFETWKKDNASMYRAVAGQSADASQKPDAKKAADPKADGQDANANAKKPEPKKPEVPPVDPSTGNRAQNKNTIQSAYSPQELAAMSPADAIAHLQSIGLVPPDPATRGKGA